MNWQTESELFSKVTCGSRRWALVRRVMGYSFLTLVFICLFSIQGSARTITADTNWSALSPVPTATEAMIIKNGATVTVDVNNAVANTVSMGAGGGSAGPGTLKFNAGSVLTLSGSTGTLTLGLSATNSGTIDMTLGGTVYVKGFGGSNGFLIPGSGLIEVTGTTTLHSDISTYNNLTVNVLGGTVTLFGATTINGNLNIAAGTLRANNLGLSVLGNWTNNSATSAFTAGTATVTFNGTSAQAIGGSFATTFNNLTVSNTGNTVTSGVSSSVAGDLSVSSGTFDPGSFTVNRASAGGTLTVSNNATLKIGGTNTFPTNYTTRTLVVASTVEYSGTNQTVANQTYGNLKFSSSSGAAVKTFPGTALAVVGNLSSVLGAGTSVSFTAASNITVNGSVSLGASTTFNGGSYSHGIGGNWVNSGTFNGNTGTITFTGSGAAVSGSGAQNFNNLTVAASAVTFSSGSITLTGNLATTGAGSFSQASGGTLLMTGSGKTISGSGISLDNLTVSGSVSTATALNLTGNLSVSGSFSPSAGTITMSGASKTISGAGTKSFAVLSVTGSVTTDANFSITSGLTVSGSLSASAGTATFTGTSTLSGTANLFNTTINGTSLQLSANSTLGIANLLTITAGTLDVTSATPNTVNFNGAGAQNINAITYDNLTLSNGNSKTATAGITVNKNITIATGTTFIAGSFTHAIRNDWNNSGSFTAGSSTIQFLGNQTTDITGATTFNILTVNKTTTATAAILQSSISASTVNMILGTILTGSNTVTITSTRTGNGIILGNIQRTHPFTTGVAYAFEGPDNTITFSSVSAVTSITVSVAQGSISDFPLGASVNRVYNIAVPSGTYNATLRLHYEDGELNGNDESTMTLWKHNGTSWGSSGKTANSITANYVEQSGLTSIINRWTLSNTSSTANVVQWNGSVSTDWNTAANWTTVQGSPTRPPSATDIVNLGTAAFTYHPTISSTVSVKNINFGSVQALTLSMATSGSLTSDAINGTWSSNATHTINVNSQSININGDLALSDGLSGHAINLNIGSGTVNVAGSLTQSGGANIVFSAAGNLNIAGDHNYVSGTFTPGTGNVTYNGVTNQIVGAVSYNDLTINKTAGEAFINNAVNISGNFLLASGELHNLSTTTVSGNVTINSGTIFESNSVIHVGGNWANNGTFVAEGSGVFFNGSGTQYISASTFGDLDINKPTGTAVLTGEVTMGGNLTITSGTLDLQTYFIRRNSIGGFGSIADGATAIIGGNNGPDGFATYTLGSGSTIIYNGTDPQYISSNGLDFGNVIFTNAGTKLLVTPFAVNGDLTIDSDATLDGSSYAITLNGNWINSGTFIPSTSTVSVTGTAKNISGPTTFNHVTVSGSYTVTSDVTFNGLLTVTATGSASAGSGRILTFNADMTSHGVVNISGTAIITGLTTQTLNVINATTFVGTISFNGSVSPVFNSTSPPQFGNLNINNTGGVNPSVGWSVFNSLTIGSGASFNGGISTHNMLGAFTNNGIVTSHGILNFLPSIARTVNLGSDFTSTGTVVFGGAGAMTLSGTPASFNEVVISNANGAGVAPSSDWNITNNFTVNSGSILNAGSYSHFVGGNLSSSGTINSGTSTFILNGTGTQDSNNVSAFNNLTINKASGFANLSSDATVNGVLSFVSGKIETGSNLLIQPSSGTITGAAQNTGWVDGRLQKSIATGATNKTFEVGDANNYTPITVAFAGVTTAGDLTAGVVSGDHANIDTSTINPAKSVNRNWTLANSGIVFATYDATFTFVAGAPVDLDAGASTAAFIVGKYSAGSWTYPTVGTKSGTSTQAIGLTAFSDFQLGESAVASTYNISGNVFEDMNYGGGAGRSLAASSGIARPGARVELFDSGGTYQTFATTDASGNYTFSALAAGNYTVRVVNYTVPPSRGVMTTTTPTQTFRTDASSGTPIPVTDHVGGETPGLIDSFEGSTTLAALTAGVNTPQSITTVALSSGNIGGVDFGYNFNVVVNANNSHQGSLRRVLIYANTMSNSGLAQSGLTAGIDNVIFMLADGTARPGLTASYASQFVGGVATVNLISPYPTISDPIVIDATRQPGYSGLPIVELNGAGAGASTTGIRITAGGSKVSGFIINRFTLDGINLTTGGSNTIAGNYIGTNSSGTAASANSRAGVLISSNNNTVGGTTPSARNVISGNGGKGVVIAAGTANAILSNSIYGNTGIGIDLADDGVTANDGTKSGALANSGMDTPVFTMMTLAGTTLTISGYVGSATGQANFASASVEVFKADNDASGFGEGQTLLGTLTTDASGNFSGTLTASLVAGDKITGTATDGSNNTSEFGASATIANPPNVALINSVLPSGSQPPGTDLVYTVAFTSDGGQAAQVFIVVDSIPANTDFKLGSATTILGTTGMTVALEYSNDNAVTWTYTPVSGGGGASANYDRSVTHVRWLFTGNLSQTSPNNTGSVGLTAKIR